MQHQPVNDLLENFRLRETGPKLYQAADTNQNRPKQIRIILEQQKGRNCCNQQKIHHESADIDKPSDVATNQIFQLTNQNITSDDVQRRALQSLSWFQNSVKNSIHHKKKLQ